VATARYPNLPKMESRLGRVHDSIRYAAVLRFHHSGVTVMSCERGRIIHEEFDAAGSARIQVEARFPLGTGRNPAGEVADARAKEDRAVMQRTFHISGCSECWVSPPRSELHAV